jgi:hypothetical protein
MTPSSRFPLWHGALAAGLAAALALAPGAALAAGHIEAAQGFLLAWGKGQWEEMAQVAADKVRVTVGGREGAIDVAGRKADATLVLPFKGLATVREGGAVKAVTVEEITVKVGGEEKKGKAVLAVEDKDGKTRVTRVTVE